MNIPACLALLALVVALNSGCSSADPPETVTAPVVEQAAPPVAVDEAEPAKPLLPLVAVHKSPSCGCCSAWVEHFRQAGYPIEMVDGEEDLTPLKLALGVPAGMASCHTAIVEGYFIEGHVPAADVARLLAERPDARGLAVPGMPTGSPGMEVPSGEVAPYTVYLVNKDGSTTPFSEYGR